MKLYPTDWRTLRFGEVGTWLSGGTPRTSEQSYWGGNIPWVGSGSLTRFFIDDAERHVTELGAKNGTRLVEPDTILMVVRGMSLRTEFRMGITRRRVAFGQDCKALVAASDIDPLFLAYAIRAQTESILDSVDQAGHGTGRLNTDQLFARPVGVPQLHEQRGIAATLGALDDKIDSNRRIVGSAMEILDLVSARAGQERGRTALGNLVISDKRPIDPKTLGREVVEHYSLPAFDARNMPECVPASAILSNKLRVAGRRILVSRLNPRTNRTWFANPANPGTAVTSTEFLVLVLQP